MAETSAVQFYLNAAGRVPLLTPAEEITLGHSVQRMMRLLNDKPEGPYDKAENRILKIGKRAKDRMILANMRLVTELAKKYLLRCQTMEMADLLQEGVIGLIRGVEKFDPSKGYKFSTYAYWWIRQGCSRAAGTQDRVIKLPSGAVDALTKARYFIPRFTAENGRPPTIEELAKECKISTYLMENYLLHASNVKSLDEPCAHSEKNERSPLVDLLACDKETPWDYVDNEETRVRFGQLKAFTQDLTPKEQNVLQLRFPILGEEPQADFFSVPQSKVGQKLGVSHSAIGLIERKAINKLKRKMALAVA